MATLGTGHDLFVWMKSNSCDGQVVALKESLGVSHSVMPTHKHSKQLAIRLACIC